MSKYYRGAPNAFAGGARFQQDQRQQQAQENALNALIQRYGPEAANPTALGQMEGIDQRRQIFPHQLGAAERSTAAHESNVERFGAAAGDPTAHGIQDQENQARRGAALNAARWLQSAKASGGDLGQAYDRIVNILPALGIPVEGVAAIREQIISNPDAVDELIAMLSGMEGGGPARGLSGGQPFYDAEGKLVYGIPMSDGRVQIVKDAQGNPMRPAQATLAEGRLDLGRDRHGFNVNEAGMPSREPGVRRHQDPYTGQVWAEVAPGSPAAFKRMQEIEGMRESSNKAIYALQFRVDQAGTIETLGQRALPILQNRKKYGVTRASARLAQSRVPGTDMYKLKDYFEDIKSNIGIEELIAIKRDGAGLGHIPMSQLQSLQRMLTDLHVGRAFREVEQDLNNIMRIFNRLASGGKDDIRGIQQRLQWLQSEWGNVSGGPQNQSQGVPQGAEDPEFEALFQMYKGGAQNQSQGVPQGAEDPEFEALFQMYTGGAQ
jgi:hypothetical protein